MSTQGNFRNFAKLLCVSVLAIGCPLGMSGETGPHVYVRDVQAVQAGFDGPAPGVQAIMSEQGTALSLASGAFHGNGTNDLVAGYATSRGGSLVMYPGRLHAFAPQSTAAWQAISQGNFPSPFADVATVFQIPQQPDFLGAGRFTNQSHIDLVTASRSSNMLYVLAGHGDGTLDAPRSIGGRRHSNCNDSGKLWQSRWL